MSFFITSIVVYVINRSAQIHHEIYHLYFGVRFLIRFRTNVFSVTSVLTAVGTKNQL